MFESSMYLHSYVILGSLLSKYILSFHFFKNFFFFLQRILTEYGSLNLPKFPLCVPRWCKKTNCTRETSTTVLHVLILPKTVFLNKTSIYMITKHLYRLNGTGRITPNFRFQRFVDYLKDALISEGICT